MSNFLKTYKKILENLPSVAAPNSNPNQPVQGINQNVNFNSQQKGAPSSTPNASQSATNNNQPNNNNINPQQQKQTDPKTAQAINDLINAKDAASVQNAIKQHGPVLQKLITQN